LLNTTNTWSTQSKNGDRGPSLELFQFKADGRTDMGHQSQRLGYGDLGSGFRGEQSEPPFDEG